MAVVSGAADLLPRVMTILNRTLRESGFFLRQAMPFLLACVEMVNKFFGGIFLLIAMVWRDLTKTNSPPPPAQNSGAFQMLQRNASGQSSSSYQRHLEGDSTYPYRRENVQRPYFTGGNTRPS